ncbi:hypothetical protein B0J11DRAFT_476144 [Dendryphion nanum]|uniref:DUF1446-domain-containing protein n=1 Tax=Dendryphion nanum TaxID=256645 RepID=A0A9P9EHR7_9PLEO|nr:hypothetical protein B0J11DRAFT_476144 [Dendryphion nanum]
MRHQAELGDVDFITGDYLAEVNIAENAQAHAKGQHPGWEPTAWDGIEQSIDLLAKKRIKLIINGGAHNPKGLAEKVHDLVQSKSLSLTVAYVLGDNILPEVNTLISTTNSLPPHFDSSNPDVKYSERTLDLLQKNDKPIVSANVYLGAREIVKALEMGADIIVAGRVADASPVIGAAQFWFSKSSTAYDFLAGSLIAGHLIECSGYVTGANFAGFDEYDFDTLIDIGFGIAEVESDGSCVVTKHGGRNGFVTEDTVKAQLLYELQGDIYLNSDVKAYLGNAKVKQVGKDRVRVTGITGHPPPPTTKLAIFYAAGYQSEILLNATGYATAKKYDLYERMIRKGLQHHGIADKFDILEFQRIGTPECNPRSQLASTTYLRIFAETSDPTINLGLAALLGEYAMQHYSGFHSTLDNRAAIPKPYLSKARIGNIVLARSGDKGANANIGFFIPTSLPSSYPPSSPLYKETWDWLRSYLTVPRMVEMFADSWDPSYHIERVEFPGILSVHFVVYGMLGRGVSGSARLDGFAKGVGDWLRDCEGEIPVKFLQGRGYGGSIEDGRPKL